MSIEGITNSPSVISIPSIFYTGVSPARCRCTNHHTNLLSLNPMRRRDPSKSLARARVLDVAERLFHERGYKAVTMRDIADELDIRQASLYYHAPGGKEELYAKVIERSMERHQAGLQEAIDGAKEEIESQLRAAAGWLLSQPPIHITRILTSDVTSLSEAEGERISTLAFDSTIGIISKTVKAARKRKELRGTPHEDIVANAFLSIVDGVWYHADVQQLKGTKEKMAKDMIKVLLQGLRPKS